MTHITNLVLAIFANKSRQECIYRKCRLIEYFKLDLVSFFMYCEVGTSLYCCKVNLLSVQTKLIIKRTNTEVNPLHILAATHGLMKEFVTQFDLLFLSTKRIKLTHKNVNTDSTEMYIHVCSSLNPELF